MLGPNTKRRIWWRFRTENRIWQQFILKNKVGNINFRHRYRLEQRWIKQRKKQNTKMELDT